MRDLGGAYMVYIILSLIIIVGLIAGLVYTIYQLDLMKSYYDYQTNQLQDLNTRYDSESQSTTERLQELKTIAYTSATTNIWNIDYFLEKSQSMLAKFPQSKFTLLAFNILNIGKINQLFGPTKGDNAVYFTAQALRKETTGQIYAQVYSNLFCVLFKDASEDAVVAFIASLTDRLTHYDENVTIYPAFGAYQITDHSMKVLEMIDHANLAVQFVKEQDDCNYRFFTEELNEQFLTNKRMSEEMEQAMENNKFVMYLQPMIDLRSYRIVSAEALVRWDYPGKGILSPYAFLPLFESTSLIQKLDYYMWEEGCKTIRRWIDNKMDPIPITLNVSPGIMQNNNFVDYLVALMDRYLIQRDLIILEIPERALITITPQLSDIINRLHNEGFILCIDNFGSKNSSLNLLKDYPIDRIKLDRTFLAKNAESPEGLTILRYLIAMAKELDFTVITEGVETQEQVNFLLELGCDIGQGYHFSKPVDLRTFDQMNKTMVNTLYRPDEYYPTFEDFERDLDLVVNMIRSREVAQQS